MDDLPEFINYDLNKLINNIKEIKFNDEDKYIIEEYENIKDDNVAYIYKAIYRVVDKINPDFDIKYIKNKKWVEFSEKANIYLNRLHVTFGRFEFLETKLCEYLDTWFIHLPDKIKHMVDFVAYHVFKNESDSIVVPILMHRLLRERDVEVKLQEGYILNSVDKTYCYHAWIVHDTEDIDLILDHFPYYRELGENTQNPLYYKLSKTKPDDYKEIYVDIRDSKVNLMKLYKKNSFNFIKVIKFKDPLNFNFYLKFRVTHSS